MAERPSRRFTVWTATVGSALAIMVAATSLGRSHAAANDDDPESGVAATADGYTLSSRPDDNMGGAPKLLAGTGPDGVSVTYIRFALDAPYPAGGATMRMRLASAPLTDVVEVTQVRADWTEDRLTARGAPVFGRVLDTREIAEGADSVEFDVSGADLTASTVAFAVTSPAVDGQFAFLARESGRAALLDLPAATPPATDPAPVPSPSQPGSGSPSPPVSSTDPVPVPPGGPSAAPRSAPPSSPTAPSTPSPAPSGDTGVPGTSSPPPEPPPTPLTEPSTSYSPVDRVAPGATARSPWSNGQYGRDAAACGIGERLVPDCGMLQGIAPAGHTSVSKTAALREYESRVGQRQHVYHSYHRGEKLFPTDDEIDVARDVTGKRLLFVNWKPQGVSWARIAAGDPDTDAYLDRLAAHIADNFAEPFFFTVHHEPEDDVRPEDGSGYTAADYAAMFRHVVERLRAGGATEIVSVMVYMAYLKWTTQPWHSELYAGDDVVDWVAWDTYGYSDPGYGHGDFAELVNRVSESEPDWPGFYRYAATAFPDKPLMIGEWGVWYSKDNPRHQAKVFGDAAEQLSHFPRLKAVLYFESPSAEGRSSQVDETPDGLAAFQRFCASKHFDVSLTAV